MHEVAGVRAVLFDTFGTVVDWYRGVRDEVARFAEERGVALDASRFTLDWRGLYQPSMEPIRTGDRPFVPLDLLHEESLRTVLRAHGIAPDDLSAAEIGRLTTAWHRLPPWPDSVPGLLRLREHVLVGPLSNGNLALLVHMARHAGLVWDAVLGADVVGAYKPQRRAYQRAVELLGLDAAEVMLVAAHNSDLHAARDAGLRTAFVPRPREFGPEPTPDPVASEDWTLVVADLIDLAERVAHARAGSA